MSDPCGTRDRILAVARSQFAQNGYHGTSMDAIVKEIGLSKGALYWHFEGKSDLFAAVLAREVDRMIHSHVEASRGEGQDVRAFVTLRGERTIEMLWEDREMRLLFFTLFIERLRGGRRAGNCPKWRATSWRSSRRSSGPWPGKSFPPSDTARLTRKC